MTWDSCLSIDDLRRRARRRLPRLIFDFLEGGAEDEWSVHRNIRAFADRALQGRCLVDVGSIDLRTSLFGRQIEWPVILAPAGVAALFHHGGESAAAMAAADCGTFFSLSTMSTHSIEAIAALGRVPRLFQVYVFRDRGLTESLLDRCRSAGYDGLILTVDTPVAGNRERDRANGLAIPPRWTLRSLGDFAAHPRWSLSTLLRSRIELANFRGVHAAAAKSSLPAMQYVNEQFDRTVTWKDAEWLARRWNGPLALKGILAADDARRAVDVGASCVWISNHGGRQLDGAAAPVDCVADVRAAVGPDVDIVLDGGVRRGTHVLKALALGASACAIGRPYLYGLAAGGQAGVTHALRILRSEIERDMALAGCPSISAIGPHLLLRERAALTGHLT